MLAKTQESKTQHVSSQSKTVRNGGAMPFFQAKLDTAPPESVPQEHVAMLAADPVAINRTKNQNSDFQSSSDSFSQENTAPVVQRQEVETEETQPSPEILTKSDSPQYLTGEVFRQAVLSTNSMAEASHSTTATEGIWTKGTTGPSLLRSSLDNDLDVDQDQPVEEVSSTYDEIQSVQIQRSVEGEDEASMEPEDAALSSFNTEVGLVQRSDHHRIDPIGPDAAQNSAYTNADSQLQSPASSPQPTGIQAKLKIGDPDGPLEREADQMAERVQRMPQKQWAVTNSQHTTASLMRMEEGTEEDINGEGLVQLMPSVQRSSDGGLSTSSDFAARLQSSSGGNPMSTATQQHMEGAFGADFSSVRIHTDPQAQQLSSDIGARAFTYKNDIYFNKGEYSPDTQSGEFLLAHELTHTIQQGAAIQPKAISQTEPQVQGFDILSVIPDWIINKARHIPGYTLFTVIILYDPLLRRRVERTPINLMEGLMGLVPFGTAIFDKLQEYDIIRKVFDWVERQLTGLRLQSSDLVDLVKEAWDELSFPYTNAIDVITRKFKKLKDRIINFAKSLVDQIMTWIKEALVDVAEPYLEKNKAWSLIKKIIKYDPLRDKEVKATTVEILEDFLLLIGKKTELEQMKKRGTLQKTADWLDTKIATFKHLLSKLKGLIVDLWNALQPSNLSKIVTNLTKLAKDTGDFLKEVWDFALDVALTVLKLVKDALLSWLREHANGIRGYKLMTVILGKDPVTNVIVPRNAKNILSGFIELVAGPEQFKEIEKSGAIERMISWLDNLVKRTGISFQMVVNLLLSIWDSVSIEDLVHPIATFDRIVTKFKDPISRVLTFIIEVVKKVIEIVLQLMKVPVDIIMQIINRAMAAFDIIKRDPIAFLINLLKAVKLGFEQFFKNILTHLLGGLTGWLFGELESAGIKPPKELSFKAILTFVLDVLGVSMEKIWQKLAAHPKIGPERVAKIRGMINRLTGIWTIIQEVITDGPGALWKHIQEQLSNLWDRVLGFVKDWVMEKIITQMVTKLLSMLDPTGIMAVIRSVESFYRAVQSFIERLTEILRIVNSFVGGILEIAQGNLAVAANFLERTMGNAMPTVIGFLANQVGLRGIGKKIGEMVGKVQAVVDKALTWLVNKVVDMGFGLFDKMLSAGRQVAGKILKFFGVKSKFKDDEGKSHSVYYKETTAGPVLMVASTPKTIEEFASFYEKKYSKEVAKEPKKGHLATVKSLINKMKQKQSKLKSQKGKPGEDQIKQDLLNIRSDIAHKLGLLMKGNKKVGMTVESYDLEGMVGQYGKISNAVGDRLEGDHQPQAALLKWARKFLKPSLIDSWIGSGRGSNAYAILLHRRRHALGATHSSGIDVGDVEKKIKAEPDLKKRRKLVVNKLKKERDHDANYMLSNVYGKAWSEETVWGDIHHETDLQDEADKKDLVAKIRGNVRAGESAIKSQPLDSLLD